MIETTMHSNKTRRPTDVIDRIKFNSNKRENVILKRCNNILIYTTVDDAIQLLSTRSCVSVDSQRTNVAELPIRREPCYRQSNREWISDDLLDFLHYTTTTKTTTYQTATVQWSEVFEQITYTHTACILCRCAQLIFNDYRRIKRNFDKIEKHLFRHLRRAIFL